jgi:predicted unusual protein kinase regulating ubiquinone biosynthesis (AarF/ABC1/UbiB family)
LDYGAIRVFPSRFVGGVIELFEAIRDDDDDHAHHAYTVWGFTDITKEKLAVLNQWARFLYEPLMQDRVRPIQENDDPQYGRSVAEKVHAGLKRTGGVRPPREFVLMDRSAIGLGSVFLRLGAQLNWSRLFQELTQDLDIAALQERQDAALLQAGVPKSGTST